jgi:hypothetical protein
MDAMEQDAAWAQHLDQARRLRGLVQQVRKGKEAKACMFQRLLMQAGFRTADMS